MITAVIAEKPSVAKDIANVLNVRERHDGYLSGNGYLVTWAFGHLVQLAMPEAYGYTGFRRENLPILRVRLLTRRLHWVSASVRDICSRQLSSVKPLPT